MRSHNDSIRFWGVKLLFYNEKNRNQQGFTLIELCLALTVMGLILATVLQQMNAYTKMKSRDDTATSLTALEAAFNEFYYQNNRHPCPADITLARTHTNYGREGTNCTAGAVITGMVPFRAMNIPENLAYDGWHNRITYAVTRTLTVAPVAATAVGAIPLTLITYDAATGTTSYAPPLAPVNAHYVLVSHGDNGVGAYNESGIISRVCADPMSPANAERTNCDANTTYTFASSRYYVNYSNGADYFDDIVSTVRTVPTRIWISSPVNRNDIYTKTSRIGIGTETPDVTVNIDVAGNIRSEDMRASVVCDNDNPLRCFQPGIISDNLPIMECGGVMTGIANGRAICASLGFEAGAPRTCAAGTYGVGFDATGAMICE